MLMRSDEPPALTNGSGIPFVGSKPENDADVEERLERDHRRQAESDEGPESIGRAHRSAQAAPGDHAETGHHHRRTNQAELFGDDAEDEVVVRLREVEQLLEAVHQAAAGDAAGGDRDHRLDHLVAVTERVAVGIEERAHPLHPVFRGREDKVGRRAPTSRGGRRSRCSSGRPRTPSPARSSARLQRCRDPAPRGSGRR